MSNQQAIELVVNKLNLFKEREQNRIMRYFSIREHQICNLAGTTFENLTPSNRKRVEIVTNVYFGKNNFSYYDGLIDDVQEVIAPLGLQISEPEEIGNTICYQITQLNNDQQPVEDNVVSLEDKCTYIAKCMQMDYGFIASWPDIMIESAYNTWQITANKAATKVVNRPLVGHIIVDSGLQFAACKVTTDSRQNVVMAFEKFCEQQLNPETTEEVEETVTADE